MSGGYVTWFSDSEMRTREKIERGTRGDQRPFRCKPVIPGGIQHLHLPPRWIQIRMKITEHNCVIHANLPVGL